ncbi:hypothetical protein HRI_003168900 [Hibiscus trionum]|uniref:Endonuclease/exonuclease/phosphatase domain-containing protein n=1 Tax=Hibiscus trionum TaxID=183268 RepID=A0A9W7IGU5_HIBTR|nr:hypothetical protein HRI_003168900 [Hibiscus trionum]
MKLLSWNVRGLGKPRTVGRLNQKLREENPSIFFLVETKLSAARMEKVRKKCGFPNGIDVDAVGRRGGLSLGWKSSCVVSLRSYSDRHIDIIIEDDSEGLQWRCTGFYGAPEVHRRQEAWDLLRSLDNCPEIPWLVIGDFNEILLSSEKRGVCYAAKDKWIFSGRCWTIVLWTILGSSANGLRGRKGNERFQT